jgi:NarL family two-component system response regulator LiaR
LQLVTPSAFLLTNSPSSSRAFVCNDHPVICRSALGFFQLQDTKIPSPKHPQAAIIQIGNFAHIDWFWLFPTRFSKARLYNPRMKQSQRPVSSPQIRVVLSDDHAIVRAGIRQFLEQTKDIKVIAESGDGKQACDEIKKEKPDVAILDIQMPILNGIQVTEWIRSQKMTTGVLILTAYNDLPYIKAVIRAGANGYVLKTASPDEIISAVRDVFAGKSVLDAALTSKVFSQLGGHSATDLVEELTAREMEILNLVARGLTNKAIGGQLSISDRTVQNHLAHIFGKLQAASRTEAVMRAVSLGLVSSSIAAEIPSE